MNAEKKDCTNSCVGHQRVCDIRQQTPYITQSSTKLLRASRARYEVDFLCIQTTDKGADAGTFGIAEVENIVSFRIGLPPI